MRPPKDPQIRINEILNAAEYLFLSKGYHETTIHDIAKRMGVAQGTMYYYFKSKDNVLKGVLERKAKDILFSVHQVQTGQLQSYEKLSAIISRILIDISSKGGIYLNLMYDEKVAAFTNQMLEYMAEALKKELKGFMGGPESDKELQVEQVDTAIFFILETISNLIDMLCSDLSQQEINAHIRMGEKVIAAILSCDQSFIKIRLT
jgi:AcrR family transcriptional regulator